MMVELNSSRIHKSDIFLGAPYEKKHTPHLLLDPTFNPLKDKINCQLFGFLYLDLEFGVKLPYGMWSAEIFNDKGLFFRAVAEDERLDRGDLCFFGSEESEPMDLHIAVVHRPNSDFNKIVLRHANKKDKQVSDWTMKKALEFERYTVLRGVRRLIPDVYDTAVRPITIFELIS